MNIAFVANYEKTIYFHRISIQLERAGHRVSWISPSRHWSDWLRAQGVASEAVLDLSRFGEEWMRHPVTEEQRRRLAELEEAAKLRFNDVILMDRVLRDRPNETVLAYFAVASRELVRFLGERDPMVVFSEQTFGVELLTAMVCLARHRDLLVPHVVRIPTGRMGFFRGHLQAELVAFRPVTADHRAAAATFLATFRRDRPRPDYFLRNAGVPVPKAAWPAKLLKHLRLELEDPFDETHFSPAWLVRTRAREVINALHHRLSGIYEVPPEHAPRPYVFFTLHRQPESSIDVLSSRLSNQIELVRALVRTLPATHELYVKEHPNGLGDRTPRMLRDLRVIPGVRLVDPSVSSFALSEGAALTLTISGTAAYEAALLQRPSATVASMFFGSILRAEGFDPYSGSLAELLRPRDLPPDAQLVEFLANVLAQSFPGLIDNPLFTPGVLQVDNIESVASGFLDLLESRRALPARPECAGA